MGEALDETVPMVGREPELRAIAACAERPDQAGVIITGRAGIGRTRLARVALAQLAAAGWRTVWLSGDRNTASIPFGAVAPLLPHGWARGRGTVAALRAIVDRVADWGSQRRTAIGVDDAHLIDDASATVVAQIMADAAAFVLATTDEAATLPDALGRLGGAVLRISPAALSPDAIDAILEHVLGGRLDGPTRNRLHVHSAGSPSRLLRLVRAGQDEGTLHRRHDVWHWRATHDGARLSHGRPLSHLRALALLGHGRLGDAGGMADAAYHAAIVDGRSTLEVGGWAAVRGAVALARGDAATSVTLLTEAVVLLEGEPDLLRRVVTALAGASGVTGDSDAARYWLAQADSLPVPGPRQQARERLDHAWVHVACGEMRSARAEAMSAADAASATRQRGLAAQALYDVARLGAARAVRTRLAALAARAPGTVTSAYGLAADGLAWHDPARLHRAADSFHTLGFELLAAEACAAAARLYAEAGKPIRAAQMSERMTVHCASCPASRTPLLIKAGVGPALTTRERQVALLATEHSSREIARRLGLSPYTVTNYLARVYAKLGVDGRGGLAAVMDRGHAKAPVGGADTPAPPTAATEG